MKPIPPKELLLSRFSYDPVTGIITWRSAPPKWDPNGKRANRKRVYVLEGKPAGSVRKHPGGKEYMAIRIFGELYQAHRLIWMIVHGEDPGLREVDHVNGDGLDNRSCNLRLATHKQNMANMLRAKRSQAGFIGVRAYGNSFRACLMIDNKVVYRHGFKTAEEAAMSRDVMAIKARGDFASLNFPRSLYVFTAPNTRQVL